MSCEELLEGLKNKEFDKWDDLKNCVDELLKGLENEDCSIRKRIVYAMGVLQLKFGIDFTEYLRKSLKDDCPWVRGNAAEALGKLNIPDDTIFKLLSDRCPWVRHRAAYALTFLCKSKDVAKKAYKHLLDRLEDTSPYVQYHVIQALKVCSDSLEGEEREEILKALDLDLDLD